MGVQFPEVSFTGSSEPPDMGWVLHSPALISGLESTPHWTTASDRPHCLSLFLVLLW